ncbi:YfcC family protein [Mesobacillus boroniphilus]|uniref:YfcC family protein n=1 Tax=Mesobacillus boroniphilus TaxID=308892 RepID=A0A944GXY4_9BACI|nr:YfcC family protein [Mesobacillus boroniphilus]MBS8266287.1 YfcC family protein [Mesobacillus boroniphilus]
MKKFKMPTAYTLLFLIIVVIAALTWVIPGGHYDTKVDEDTGRELPIAGTYQKLAEDEQTPQGLWEVLNAPINGFFDAKDIALFVLVIGGFLGVVMKTGAIDAGIARVIRKLKGREQWLIPILMILFAIGGSTYGMAEETIAFYPILIPVLIAAGYDSLTAVSIIAIGAGIGCLGSTVNPFATGIASGFAGISIGDGIVLRLIILAVTLIVGILFVMRYAKKVKDDPSKSLIAEFKEENEKHFLSQKTGELEFTGRHKAVLSVFALTFVVMILGVIPWAYKFNISIFEDMTNALASIPVIGKFLGGMMPLGDWWFGELTMLFLTSSIIIAFIYRMEEEEFTSTFVNGARDLLGVALIIAISRGITVVMDAGGMTATVLHWGEGFLSDMGSVVFTNLAFLFYLPLSFLVPSTSGLATLSMPIMAPLADFAGVSRHLVITAYQSASGVVNLLTPTSAVIMGALAIARIPYTTYLKHVWKLVVVLSVIVMIILSIATMLN